ncbi:four-carbon acid sugar kinase family protein [Rhizobium sp. TRM95111]|uniref:four-carbon acid sugar kinase family protein n=1 Tax=Rhizobium alarense TaxID=2846851 RepID=UPI001F210FB2|nr:four-carbon acid sugar kinase family protein [Rhizobium alarense]MCF3638835.1 four-carbon acid sugar kinase family protein [Rhizobium alarense]
MLTILADDLTGALDSAAPFAGRGLHTEVVLALEAIPEALQQMPAVLSINVGSRDVDAETARRATLAVFSHLPSGTRLFKKVDSRLKGNIVAELDVTPFASALVIPAIPEFGRVVKYGQVRGFGVDDPIPIAERLGRHAARATIPDTGSEAEIVDALEAAWTAGTDLLIGARGAAGALALQMTGGVGARQAEIPAGGGLFVIGSRDPITLTQVDALRADIRLRYLPAPNGKLDGISPDGSAVTLVQAVPGATSIPSHQVSRHLADAVCPALVPKARTLILSGGATAEAVLKKMGVSRFRLLGECLPGLGLAHARSHCIIAKSGGFGQPDTLRTIASRILQNTV